MTDNGNKIICMDRSLLLERFNKKLRWILFDKKHWFEFYKCAYEIYFKGNWDNWKYHGYGNIFNQIDHQKKVYAKIKIYKWIDE